MSSQLIKSKGRELNSAVSSYQSLKRSEKIAKNSQAETSKAMRKETDAIRKALKESPGAESFDLDFEGESEVELTSPDGSETLEIDLPEPTDYARLRDEFITGIPYDPNFTLEEEDQYYTAVNEALENPHESFSGATFFTDDNGVILVDDNGNALGEADLDYPQEIWEAFKWICTFYLAYLPGKQAERSLRSVLKGIPPEEFSDLSDKLLELPYHSQVSGDDACSAGGKLYRSQEVLLDIDSEEGRNILRKRLKERVMDPNERERLLSHVDILDPDVDILLPDGSVDVTCLPKNLTRQRRNSLLGDLRNALNPSVDLTTPEGRAQAAERLQSLQEPYNTDAAVELVERIQKLRTEEDPIVETEAVAKNTLSDWGVNVDVEELLESLESFIDSVAGNYPQRKDQVYNWVKLWFKREMPQNQYDNLVLKLLKNCCPPSGREKFDRLQSLGHRLILRSPENDNDWENIWNQLNGILTSNFSGSQLEEIRKMVRVLLPQEKPDSLLDMAGNLESELETVLDNEVADPRTEVTLEDKDKAMRAFRILRFEHRPREEVQEYRASLNRVFKKFVKEKRADAYREICHTLAGSDFLFQPYLESVQSILVNFHLNQITDENDREKAVGLVLFAISGEVTDYLKNLWEEEIYELYESSNYEGHILGLSDGTPRAYLHLGALTFHLIHVLSMDEYGMEAYPERLISAAAAVTNLGVTNSEEQDLDNLVTSVSGPMLDPADAVSAYFELKQGTVDSSILTSLDNNIQVAVPSLVPGWTSLKNLFETGVTSASSQADNPDTRRLAPATLGSAAQTYISQYISVEATYQQTLTGNTPTFRTTRKSSSAAQAPEIFHGNELQPGGPFQETRSYQVIRDPKYELVGGDEFFRRVRTFANRDSKVAREGNRISQQINKFRTQTTGRILTKTQDFRADAFRIRQDVMRRMASGVGQVNNAIASVLCLLDALHDLIKVMNGAIADIAGIGREILRSATGLVEDIRNSLRAIQQTLLGILRTLAVLLRTQIGVNCACMSVNFSPGMALGNLGLDSIANWITGAFPNVPNPFDMLGDLLNDFQNFLTLDPKLGCPQNIIRGIGGDSALSSATNRIFG